MNKIRHAEQNAQHKICVTTNWKISDYEGQKVPDKAVGAEGCRVSGIIRVVLLFPGHMGILSALSDFTILGLR